MRTVLADSDERSSDLLACLDGVVMSVEEARIPVTDDGLLRGDGVFEVARIYGGGPFALEQHFARLARSAENLRLDLDMALVEEEVRRLLDANHATDVLLRILATRGGHRVVLLEELP